MPRLRLRHPDLPPALTGWVAANPHLQPRFWATVWVDVLKAKLDEGTRGRHLAAVERLYESVARQLGDDRLDAVLARADFETLEAVLGGFLTTLRNESAVQATDREGDDFVLSVSDDGIGMPVDDARPHASAGGRLPRGTGLGTRLLQGLAAQLRGALSRQVGIGAGTSAELRFPAGEPGR